MIGDIFYIGKNRGVFMTKSLYTYNETHCFVTGKTPASVIGQRNRMNYRKAMVNAGTDHSDIAVCVVSGIAAITAIGVGIAAFIDHSDIVLCVVAGLAAVTAIGIGVAAFIDHFGDL